MTGAAEPAEVALRRLYVRPVEQVVPPGMAADPCHFSRTGFALWELGADGAPARCTCRPVVAPALEPREGGDRG